MTYALLTASAACALAAAALYRAARRADVRAACAAHLSRVLAARS